jgi:Bacterial Ig-like domain (group 2)
MVSRLRLSCLYTAVGVLVNVMLATGCVKSETLPTSPSPDSAPNAISVAVGVAANAPPTLAPGEHLQLWAVATYSDHSTKDVTNTATWQSSNPSVATISRDGVLTAAVEGSVDVFAAVGHATGSLNATIRRLGCGASTLSPSTLTFNAFDHSAQLQVRTPQADCRWVAKSDADWIRFDGRDRTTFDPGQSGVGAFSYAVLANNYPDLRTGHVIVSFTDGSQLLHSVTQEQPVSCSYVVTPDDAYFSAAGGAGAFEVTTTPSDCRWTATANYDFYGIHLTSSSTGIGAAHVTYAVTQPLYGGAYARDGSIVIAGLSGVNPAAVHKIHIAAP